MGKIKWTSGILAGVLLLLTGITAQAEQWQIVGPRALGMGGAHVAVVNDATAQYWNPAAFGFFGRQAAEDEEKKDEHSGRDAGFYIHGGLGYQAHEDILKEIEDINKKDLSFTSLSNDISSGDGLSDVTNVDEFVKMIGELEDLNRENIGITALADLGANIRVRNWAIGAMGFAEIAAIPQLDLVNINPDTASTDLINELGTLATDTGADTTSFNDALSTQQTDDIRTTLNSFGWTAGQIDEFLYALDDGLDQENFDASTNPVPQEYVDYVNELATLVDNAATGSSFDNNTSSVLFRGALVREVPLTYGHAYSDNFSVGGNIKAMKARTYYHKEIVFNTDTDDFFDRVKDDYKESSDFGVDLGALYKTGPWRFGIVGRNLNKPEFDYAGPGDYEIDPQVRAGVALRLWDWITLAADIDVTENDTNISDNYKSRNAGVGAEFDLLSFLRLRAGAYKNLSESDIGLVYTAGLGFNFYLFQLDVGASMASDTATIDGDELPEEVRGELALSFQF